MKRRTKTPPRPTRGVPLQVSEFHRLANELSLSLSEEAHVETIEEANDFNIPDDDSEDFLQNVTVYEMHEMAEENLSLYQQNQALAESNETGDQGEEQTPHDQSAPVEPNSLDPSNTPSLSKRGEADLSRSDVSEAKNPAPPQGI